jgi:hypothetical protein
MKRSLITFAAAAAVAVGLGALALANSGSISDPKGDVKHNPSGNDANYDIVKATFGHARHGKLKHTVRVDGKIGDPTASGPNIGSQPSMFIDVPHHSFSGNCDYRIDPVPPGAPGNGSSETKYLVFRCSNGPNSVKTGSAHVTRPDNDTDKFVFKKGAIGNPKKYGWAFHFVTDTSNGLVDADRAPNKGFKVHRLR